MTDLPKYTLFSDEAKGDWVLKRDGAERATKRFATKAEATKGGALEDAVSKEGGSVKIQKTNGEFEEERTFPRWKDPVESEG